MDFVKLTETNDHEGETWRWWLQVDGNVEHLDKLRQLIREADPEGQEYDLAVVSQMIPEHDVDVLCQHSGGGYYAYDNKVVGVLECPDSLGDPDDEDDAMYLLYKGGVREFFKITSI